MKRIRNTSINNFDNKSLNEIRSIVISYKQSQNLSPKTFDVYKRVFKEFDIYFDKNLNLYELKMREASQFIEYLLKDKVYYLDRFHNTGRVRGIKPTTVNTYLKACKSIYQVLVDLEYIESNPFKKIKTVKRQEERIKTIPEDDINKLIDSLDKNYYTDFRMIVIIHVLLDTFGRINEVLNMKVEDIDFETNTIYFGETKSNQYRYVPFSNKTKKLLIELIEETKEFRSDYIFLTQYGTVMTPNNFRSALNRYLKQFKISTHITPHMFRHTASTLFLKNGGSINVLQKILGHKKITTTEIYTHLSIEDVLNQSEEYSPLNSIVNTRKYNKLRNKRRK